MMYATSVTVLEFQLENVIATETSTQDAVAEYLVLQKRLILSCLTVAVEAMVL